MSYNKEMLENDKVQFTFDVDQADWKSAIDEAYNKSKNKYQVGGFRKGHVPRKVIESMYGVGVFFEDALDIILPKYYAQAMDAEKELVPVDRPEIDINAISDTTLKFTATVQLKPTVTLGQYTGLTFKKEKVKVSKEEMQAEIDKALESAGAWEDITDRPAQLKDKVLIDYSGSVDGVKFDGGTAEKQPLELGSNMFIPGFEDQIVGMRIGESKDITVKFPEDYHAEELKGKDAVFAVKLHEITVKNVPAYDDEFVKDVSDCETVKEYEAQIKEQIKTDKEKRANAKLENDMVEKFAELASVNVPECMIESQAEQMVEEFEYRLMYQGLNKDDYYKMTGTKREDLIKTYHESAAKNVRIKLVLSAIMDDIKIPVSDEDVDAKIAEMAEAAGKSVEEYSKGMNDEYRGYIRNELVTDKLFAYLMNNNTIE